MDVHKRSNNFTPDEIEVLMGLVLKYKHIIECKKTDAVYSKEKASTWEKIKDEFNALQQSHRETQTLKTKYENIKKRSKKKFAAEKKELYTTGGGKVVSVGISDIDEMVQDLLKEQMTGLESIVDTDTEKIADEVLKGHTIPKEIDDSIMLTCSESPTKEKIAGRLTIRGNRRQQQQHLCSEEWVKLAKEKSALVFEQRQQHKELHQLKLKQMQEEHNLRMTAITEEAQLKKMKLELEIEFIKNNK